MSTNYPSNPMPIINSFAGFVAQILPDPLSLEPATPEETDEIIRNMRESMRGSILTPSSWAKDTETLLHSYNFYFNGIGETDRRRFVDAYIEEERLAREQLRYFGRNHLELAHRYNIPVREFPAGTQVIWTEELEVRAVQDFKDFMKEHGYHPLPVTEIRGTYGREGEFDMYFNWRDVEEFFSSTPPQTTPEGSSRLDRERD